MSGKRSRDKGARFEREIANTLSREWNLPFARGIIQTRGGGAEVADVCLQDVNGAKQKYPHIDKLHLECKHHKKASIPAAWRQAEEDCATSGRTPVCITKSDREKPLVTMRLEDWMEIMNVYIHHGKAEPKE